MIVGSLLLILVAVVLLVLGLADGSSGLLIGSIGASMLAAVALVVGARQAAAARAAEFADVELDDETAEREAPERVVPRRYAAAGVRATGAPAGRGEPGGGEPEREEPPAGPRNDPLIVLAEPAGPAESQRPDAGAGTRYGAGGHPVVPPPAGAAYAGSGPPDEPPAQVVAPADAARIVRMSTEVLVVDGRPRYHLPGCVHLLGRACEPLPVGEAVEIGFTPCSLCEPDNALLS